MRRPNSLLSNAITLRLEIGGAKRKGRRLATNGRARGWIVQVDVGTWRVLDNNTEQAISRSTPDIRGRGSSPNSQLARTSGAGGIKRGHERIVQILDVAAEIVGPSYDNLRTGL